MSARRCTTCAINYPDLQRFEKCDGCDGSTDRIGNIEMHDDWEERLLSVQKAVSAMPEVDTREDTNRLDRFRRAGLDLGLAMIFAGNKTVDLHEFERLVSEGCSPEAAARILAPLDS